MAIRLQFINLVIPIATLDRVLAEEGGFAGFMGSWGGMPEMVWHDAHLCRVDGAMNWPDVEGMLERWAVFGLQGLVGTAPQQWWKDLAVCASGHGPTFPCDWLQYDAADNCVYLSGTARGEIVGPAPLS